MDAQQKAVAERCLAGAYDNSMSFPQSVGALMQAGFEGYLVDFRSNTRTHYLPDGETLVLGAPVGEGEVAAAFDAGGVAAAVRWAQRAPADYSYAGFSAKVTSHGCAGYIVSFAGRRVVYFGRTAELHVEHFPQ